METIKTELEKRDLQRMSNEESNKITRECLQTALIYLMEEKSFDKISITELVKRSGVSRTAFYRNYTTKESILEALVKDIIDKTTDFIRNGEILSNPESAYVDFYKEIRSHQKIIMSLLHSNLLKIIMDNISMAFEELLDSIDEKNKYIFTAVSGAHMCIMARWIKNNMTESDEYMAKIVAEVQERLIAGYDNPIMRKELS